MLVRWVFLRIMAVEVWLDRNLGREGDSRSTEIALS